MNIWDIWTKEGTFDREIRSIKKNNKKIISSLIVNIHIRKGMYMYTSKPQDFPIKLIIC
jgi:hypothetical protein